MSEMPVITQDAIRARVGGQSYSRGASYFRTGAIFAGRRQGMTLKSQCRGSSANSYRVEATLGREGIEHAYCSCPVGGDGYCKHVAALLLTWNDRPESFVEVESLDVALGRRSKEELIALIQQMLRRVPELEALLEAPLPVAGRKAGPINPEVYRGQAQAILGGMGYEWGAARSASQQLHSIREVADGFARNEEHGNAAGIYSVLCDEILEQFDYEDENGSLGSIVRDCVEGLIGCLAPLESDPDARADVLDALFAVYRFDTDYGGIGLGDDAYVALTEQTTPEERRRLATRVHDLLVSDERARREWQRNAYGGFLLDLEAETMDDESYLRICRETGRHRDLTERLLALGRLEDAVAAAEEAGDYVLIALADLIEERGHAEAAERLIRHRAVTSTDSRLLEWLKPRVLARGDQGAAFEIAERHFMLRPSIEEYRDARGLANFLGRWERVRPKLRERAASDPHLLVAIYLDDGEIDPAVELVVAEKGSHYYSTSWSSETSTAIDVARAAAEPRPQAALTIYRREIDTLIRQRGREYYQQACRYLKELEALHRRLGEEDAWNQYFRELRDETRTLRAFKEELAAAGLIA